MYRKESTGGQRAISLKVAAILAKVTCKVEPWLISGETGFEEESGTEPVG